MSKKTSEWSEEFDKEYAIGTGRRWIFTSQEAKEIKQFIADTVAKSREDTLEEVKHGVCDKSFNIDDEAHVKLWDVLNLLKK